MSRFGRSTIPVLFVFLSLVPRAATAQPARLDLATVAASAAAAADWTSTYHGLKHYNLRESNPLLQPWQQSPEKLVSMGAVMDVGAVTTWNFIVGRNHPRVAVTGLWGMTAFRTYLAVHNLRNERKYGRRSSSR